VERPDGRADHLDRDRARTSADLPVIEAIAYLNAAALFLLLQTVMTLRRMG
jgi:hypothetical protein